MNWIKQNKLLTGIAVVAILGSLALLWFAFSSMGAAAKSVSSHKSSVGEIGRLQNANLFPSAANLSAKDDAVANLQTETLALRTGLGEKFGAKAGEDPATFGQRVQKKFEELKTEWEAAGVTIPKDFFLGLDRYRQSVAANPSAVADLDTQLSAICSVISATVKSGVTSVDKFTRAPVAGEEGGPSKESVQGPLRRYGMEIQCTGSETSIRTLVNSLSAATDHFFAFRAIRLQNETQAGPKKDEVRKKVASAPTAAAGGAADLFALLDGGNAAPAPAPAPAPMSDAERLMANMAGQEGGNAGDAPKAAPFVFAKESPPDAFQFLGSEKVKATIRLDLVLFPPAAEKEEKPQGE
ncbi:MAG: Amuc_1100 family pilus-like protein [Verrucomicrobiales bacterium]